jgi:hypothetical protein
MNPRISPPQGVRNTLQSWPSNFYYYKLYMNYNNFVKNYLSHYGDVLAIPFFALLIYYFYNIKKKSTMEYILLYFSISGFILDILYTYVFLVST